MLNRLFNTLEINVSVFINMENLLSGELNPIFDKYLTRVKKLCLSKTTQFNFYFQKSTLGNFRSLVIALQESPV